MWRTVWLAGLLPVLAGTAAVDQKKLQGTWVARSAERQGKLAGDIAGHRLSFTGNRFAIHSPDGKLLYEGTFRLDASKSPATIDLEQTGGPLKGKVWKGIYSLEGDLLRTCDNAPDSTGPRPMDFRTRPGSGTIAILFKRAKP